MLTDDPIFQQWQPAAGSALYVAIEKALALTPDQRGDDATKRLTKLAHEQKRLSAPGSDYGAYMAVCRQIDELRPVALAEQRQRHAAVAEWERQRYEVARITSRLDFFSKHLLKLNRLASNNTAPNALRQQQETVAKMRSAMVELIGETAVARLESDTAARLAAHQQRRADMAMA